MNNHQDIINASCTITRGKVFKNGKLIFESEATPVFDFLPKIYDFLTPDYPKFYKMDNLSKLGWLATEVLLGGKSGANLYPPEKTAVVLSNSNSSLDTDLRYFQTVTDYPSPSLFVYTLPNIVIGEICIRHKFQGENAFFVFEKFEPDFICDYTSALLHNGSADFCICGWVELLADQYKATLCLVAKNGSGIAFNSANMLTIFNLE